MTMIRRHLPHLIAILLLLPALVRAQDRISALRSTELAADLPPNVTELDFGVLPERPGDQPSFLPLSTDERRKAPAVTDTTPHGHWDRRFGLPGVKGRVNAIAVAGNEVFVGGVFHEAGGEIVNNIAMWDGNRWRRLGAGVDGAVHALAVIGDNVYVGGAFVTVGGIPIRNIGIWNRRTQRWSDMGEGIGGSRFSYVATLAVDGNDLYVGGRFLTAGRIVAVNIAKWNGSRWSRVGSGANGYVFTIRPKGNGLYVGGRFTVAGDKPMNRIGYVDKATGEWFDLDGGVVYRKDSGFVSAIEFIGDDVYVGGRFATAGFRADSATCIARFNPTTRVWSRVGAGLMKNHQMFITSVYTFLAYRGDLYVGGDFDSTDTITASFNSDYTWRMRSSNFAKYSPAADRWSIFRRDPDIPHAYSSGVLVTTPRFPYRNLEGADIAALTLASDGRMLIGGAFNFAGPVSDKVGINDGVVPSDENVHANGICTFDGDRTWGILGSSLGGPAYAVATSGDDVYVGGSFSTAGMITPNNIARWNSTTGLWSSLGDGIGGTVRALAVAGSRVYAGGDFAGSSNLLSWDGSSWSAPGTPPFSGYDTVRATALRGNDLYVGSDLGLHLWNGSTWSAVGGNVNGTVRSIAISGDSVIVGGDFTSAGTIQAPHVAIWNATAGTWSAPGTGPDGRVNAVLPQGPYIYAAGEFMKAGTKEVNNIARWDGTAARWEALDEGLDGRINSLTILNGSIFAVGHFPRIGIVSANSAARWDGTRWYDVDRGIQDRNGEGNVFSSAASADALYVVGNFQWAGGISSYHIARWTNTPAPVALAVDLRGAPASGVTVAAQPNPISTAALFSVELPTAGKVRLSVFDMEGREIEVLHDGELSAGTHAVSWNTPPSNEGIYMYVLRAGAGIVTGRLLVIR